MGAVKKCRTVEDLESIKGVKVVDKGSVVEVRWREGIVVRWERENNIVFLNPIGGDWLAYGRINQGLEALGTRIRVCGDRVMQNDRGIGVVWV